MFLLTAPARALQSLLWAMLSSSLSLAPLAAPWGKPTSLVPRILILTSLITFRHDPGRCGIRHITWLPKYLSGKTPEIQGTLVSKNQSWTESYSFLPWIIQSIFFFFPYILSTEILYAREYNLLVLLWSQYRNASYPPCPSIPLFSHLSCSGYATPK